MNWLLIIILIIFALSVIQGLRKGLIRTIVSTFFLVFVMVISVWLAPYVESILKENTKIEVSIEKSCHDFLENKISEQLSGQNGAETGDIESPTEEQQKSLIDLLPIPETLKSQIANNNNAETYEKLVAGTFTDYVAKYLSGIGMYILSFLIAFILAVIIIQIILKATDIMTELPLIGLANRLGGGAAGALRALLWIWIFFALIVAFGNTSWGQACLIQIKGNAVLEYFYNNNLLLNFILNLFGK